ncbi:MAG TPA: hypothetical protein VM889_06355 [Candidatus Thermoplasmatota archaeon]|nr:hypothetical protein [Candidatus Thermoplasmatota archaeon]
MTHGSRAIAFAIAGALAFTAPAFAGYTNLNHEIDEAFHPFERNNLETRPERETLILDDFFAITNLGLTPDPTEPTRPFGLINVQRSAGAYLGGSDVILPGGGQFYALYGLWNDTDQDGIVDWTGSESCPASEGSEFCRREGAELLSFVDPGSHPAYDANERPPADRPDFTYIPWLGNPVYTAGQASHVWFYDGSLARPVTVMTFANATLEPDALTGKAYTCKPGRCLSDVDVYHARAPGPVEALFTSVLGPVIDNVLPTVGFSSLVLPPALAETLDGVTGPVLRTVAETTGPHVDPPYEDETHPNAGSSTSAIGREAYAEEFHVWFDARAVQVMNGVAGASWGPGPRSLSSDGPSFPPGWMSVSANLGVARDLDGDGFIATARGAPTFDGAEFIGGCLGGSDWPNRTTKNLHWRLVPKDGWGAAPVVEYDATGYTNPRYPILGVVPNIIGPTGRTFTGSEVIDGYSYCYTPDKNHGLHAPGTFLLFPLGAPAFTLEFGAPDDPAGVFTYEIAGAETGGPFWDVDAYAGWT